MNYAKRAEYSWTALSGERLEKVPRSVLEPWNSRVVGKYLIRIQTFNWLTRVKLWVFTFNCSATVKLQHCMRKRIRVSSAKCLRNAARRFQRKQNSRTCFAFLTTLRQTFFSLYRWKHRVPHTSNASLMQYHAHGAVNKYITSLLSARNFCRAGERPMFVLKTAEANELQIKLLFSFFSSTNSSRKTYRITKALDTATAFALFTRNYAT